MFCTYCGKQIDDQSAFCMYCGKNISNTFKPQHVEQGVDEFKIQKENIRESETKALQEAIAYFSIKKDVYYEYDNICELVDKYSKGAKSTLLVWGSIFSTIGLVGQLSSSGDAGVCLILLLLPGLMMIGGGIAMKVNSAKKYNSYQEKFTMLSQELYQFYSNYPNCPIGFEISNPRILTQILYVLQSGRADTIKESINLLINDKTQEELKAQLEAIEERIRHIKTGPIVFR